MVTREEVVAEIRKVPEKYLEELYKVVKNFEERSEESPNQNVMEALRQIKISASPDFSIKANLYDTAGKTPLIESLRSFPVRGDQKDG